MNECRIALRRHLRHRGFALTVVCTLSVTIAATTTVFLVVNTVLVRALPFASPERLVWIASVRSDNPSAPFTLPEFMDYRSQTRTLTDMAAFANWSASIASEGITERLTGARMSANAFDVLGVSPAAGRLLTQSDDLADASRVVVISYRLWQRRYGGSISAVGSAVRINGESFLIVGVLPPHFPLPLRDIDIVTPLIPERDPLRHLRNSVNFLRLFGRLAPASEASQAQSELTTICRSLRQQFPVEYARKDAVRVTPLHEVLVADHRQAMLILLAAVVVVLATALANLTSLALVRANRRRAELAMQIAVGASWWHITRQLTVEALLLAVAGSGLGCLLAAQTIGLVMQWAPSSIPRLEEVSIDARVVWFVMGVTAVVTALFTAAPLGVIAKTRTADALRAASRGAIGDRWNHRTRNAMVILEISAALVLVLATILIVRNLLQLRDVHPGFEPDGVFQARVSIPPTYRSPDDVSRFYERVSERLAASPGVQDVGVISVAPLSGLLATVPFTTGGPVFTERDRMSANLRVISAGYLSAVGSRVLEGRAFSETDRSDTPAVALVSAALADRLLSGRAVGQRLFIDDNNRGPRPIEIVGVVENVRHVAIDLPPALDIYLPLRQIHPDGVSLIRNNQFWMIRSHSDPEALRSTFLAHLRAVDPDAAVSGTSTMRQFLDAWFGPRRFNLALFGAFALTALLLAMVGLYGLVSYAVTQRAPEIALLMALGASERDVQGLILRQAARLGVAGSLVGLALAAVGQPLVARVAVSGSGEGQEVSMDPAVAVATAAVLLTVVLVAAWAPARRAARIEPSEALKS